MKKLSKLILLVIISMVFWRFGYAEVIELDNQNPDHCRQQIFNSSDHYPVILASSLQDAKNKMKSVFATLVFKNGPNDYGSAWQCAYTNANNDDARALTKKTSV